MLGEKKKSSMIWNMFLSTDPREDSQACEHIKGPEKSCSEEAGALSPKVPKSFDHGACHFLNNFGRLSPNVLWKMMPPNVLSQLPPRNA